MYFRRERAGKVETEILSIIDLIASNYGWSYQDIINLDYQEIIGLVEQIRKREDLQFRQQAAIHGVKLRPRGLSKENKLEKIDEEKSKMLDNALRNKLEEIRRGK